MTGAADATPLVILAASARALAECLRRAGLPGEGRPLLAVDAFGDDDLMAAVDGWRHIALGELSQPARVHAVLGAFPGAEVLIGGGFDGAFDVLRTLAADHRLLNAPPDTWRAARDPLLFARLGIEAPDTRSQPPADRRGWLCKRRDGSAGLGVRRGLDVPARDLAEGDAGFYWQRRIVGTPVSLLFCVHAGGTVGIGINRQWCSPAPGLPFCFGGIASGFDAGASASAALVDMAQRISVATGLRGLCSLDAVIDRQGRVHALEVNPRPTASVELYDRESPGLMALHRAAVLGHPLPPWAPAPVSRALALVRAPVGVRAGRPPRGCSDWRDGAVVDAGDPLCTVHAEAVDAQAAMHRARCAAASLRRRLRRDVAGSTPDGGTFLTIATIPNPDQISRREHA